jgi:2-polyprenyl-6-hydroxyphenyl methylase/3-demethylubiquinone-9 3-methyltransferase
MNRAARPRNLLRRVLALYDESPRADRLFARARAALSDLAALERHAPREGAILDLGCGHGLVSNLLALGSPARDVTGIDIDAAKIAAARRTLGARTNVRFVVADATTFAGGPYAAITVADVFYLIPPEGQRALLASCARMLAPDGVLIWKSQVRRPRWKYAITRGQEWLMTTLGPTQGHGLYFLDTDESLDALRGAGLRAVTLTMRSWRPYSDVLFLAYKPGEW